MKIDVYDSYANSEKRGLMHFDVFVGNDSSSADALKYGQQWLQSIGEDPASLSQSRCNFCHSEIANPKVKAAVEENGYFILQMEGCPGRG